MLASLATNMLSNADLPRIPSVDELILTLLEREAAVNDWDGLAAVRAAVS